MERIRTLAPRISKSLFYLGAATGVFALIRTWLLNRGLPEGVCPIDTNRPLLYVALGMLAGSLLLDFLFPVHRKAIPPAGAHLPVPEADTPASGADTSTPKADDLPEAEHDKETAD